MCYGNKISSFTSDMIMCGNMRSTVYVKPCIFDVVVMIIKTKGDVCWVICTGFTDNRITFGESCHDWFEFISMLKYQMPCVNFMKNIRWKKFEKCFVFVCTSLFFGKLEVSNVTM